MSKKLLDAVTANTDGAWVHYRDLNRGQKPESVYVEGITTATVSLEVANGADTPSGAGDEIMSLTANDMQDLIGRYDWYRARVTGYSAGTITVTIT